MDKQNFNEKIIFSIMIEDLQQEAIRLIGRKLTENEIYNASKGVEAGLSFGLDNILRTAVEETTKVI